MKNFKKNELCFIREYKHIEDDLVENIIPVVIAQDLNITNFTNEKNILKYDNILKEIYILVYLDKKYKLINIEDLIKKEEL